MILGGPAVPPGSPALWIRADKQALGNATSLLDISGNGNSIPIVAGTNYAVNTAAAGPTAALPAYVFGGGSSNYYQIASNFGVGTKNFTIAVVAKVTSTSAQQAYVLVGSVNTNGVAVGVDINGTGNRDFNEGATAIADASATTSWEAWVLSSDSSGNLTLLVNGSSQTLSPSANTATAPSAVSTVGANSAATWQLTGSIFEILVWTTMQNNAAVAAYQQAVTGL